MTTTDYIEKTLEELVLRHGAARVRADLSARGGSDWQRLVNITNNIQRRLERTKNEH